MTILVHQLKKSERVRTYDTYDSYRKRWVRTQPGDRPNDPNRVYIDFQGESIMDNLNNRRQRPYTTLKPLVVAALENEGYEVESIRWSSKAGCKGCPCSPGFLVEFKKDKWEPKSDFWLTVTDDEEYPKIIEVIL